MMHEKLKLNLRCFNCGEPGHVAVKCSKPKGVGNKDKNVNVNAFLQNENFIMQSEHKRIRVEDLLDNKVSKIVEFPKKKERLKKSGKEHKNKKINFSKSMLESPSNVSWRKLLQVYPEGIEETIKGLQKLKNKKTVLSALPADQSSESESMSELTENESSSSESEDEVHHEILNKAASTSLLSYTICEIVSQTVPVFMDVGASSCVCSVGFLNVLGLTFESKRNFITQVGGSTMKILGETSIVLKYGTVSINVLFKVLPRCAVPILLGLDIIQSLNGRLDYEKEIFRFVVNGKSYETQLYSKNDIREEFESVNLCQPVLNAMLLSEINENIHCIQQDIELPLDHLEVKDKDFCFQESVEEIIRNTSLDAHEKDRFRKLMNDFKELFPESVADLPGIKEFTYSIHLKPDSKPYASRLRRFSAQEKEIIKQELEIMKDSGIIVESDSSWCFPVVLVPKKDGSWRFCVNFRKLNEMMERDHFPLPRIDDCLDFLGGKSVFSCVDCFAGYWQVRLDEETARYCSFITPFGVYSFNVMPFGLTNAPAVFQKFMDRIFAEFLYEFLVLYLDDICIASESMEGHFIHLEKVFERARKFNLRFKLKKCQFFVSQFTYLGFEVSSNGISPNYRKVKVFQSLEYPKNIKELRSFLYLASYFRRFIDHFSVHVEPLNALLRKGRKFEWDEDCSKVFNYLKGVLQNPPYLKQPDEHNIMVLSTDASSYAIGAVLEQYDDNGSLRPIHFYSRRC
jgi:hypothetical protein